MQNAEQNAIAQIRRAIASRSIPLLARNGSDFATGDAVMVLWHAFDEEPARAAGPFMITHKEDGRVRIAGYPPSKWDSRTGASPTGASTIVRWFDEQ